MLISVIIPVYNAEKYLRRCIDSVIAQTYEDWELIVVDDGSTDNSWAILSEYVKKDSRINIVHQDNAGAGLARNKGLEYASGEYTVFIDADDYIEPNYFELLTRYNQDIVFIDAYRRNQEGVIDTIEKMSSNKGKNKEDIIRSQMTGKTPWGGWRKAVKTSLLKKHDIKYTEHKVGEEAVFSFMLLHYTTTIGFIETPVYNYEVHSGSLSQSLIDDPWGQVALVLKDKLIDMQLYEMYANTINAFIKTATIVSLDKMAQKYDRKEYVVFAKKRIEAMSTSIDALQGVDYKNMSFKAKLMLPFIDLKLVNFVYIVSNLRKSR